MSHAALRVGRFFALHTLHQAPRQRSPAAAHGRRCGVATARQSRGRDDLAFFGLCMEVNHDDPRAELERLALVTPDAQIWDETPLLLL